MKKISGLVLLCSIVLTPIGFGADAADAGVNDHAWELYTFEKDVRCLLLSADGSTLWAGGRDGLEEKDAATGRRTRFYPHVDVQCLLDDGDGGLWIGTEAGLVHFKADGARETFTTDNSDLPGNVVNRLIHDEAGGLWIASDKGVAHMKPDGAWDVFTTANSEAPRDSAGELLCDGAGGVWIGWHYIPGPGMLGSGGIDPPGLSHLKSDGSWELFDVDNSGLPSNSVNALLGDGDGGVWIGMIRGMARLKSDGSWEVLGAADFDWPSSIVSDIVSDGRGGFWSRTSNGLVHVKTHGAWDIFTIDNSALTNNWLFEFAGDSAGGIWTAKTREHLVHFAYNGASRVFQSSDVRLYTRPPPSLDAIADDGAGGVWILADRRLSRLKSDGSYQIQTDIFPEAPLPDVVSIDGDGAGGLWARTSEGLMRVYQDGSSERAGAGCAEGLGVYSWSLFGDDAGGCWIVCPSRIAHLKSDGSWNIHADSPYHPSYGLLADGADGLWFMHFLDYPILEEVFVHLPSDGGAEIFPWVSYESHSDYVNHFINDGAGGLWIGSSSKGLSHLTSDGAWEVFNADNSELPSNLVTRVLRDGAGGVWTGTYNGLGHLMSDGAWEIFNADNSELPDNHIHRLIDDGDLGLWAVTASGPAYDPWRAPVSGFAHLKSDGAWEIVDMAPANGCVNDWATLVSDGAGGLWVDSRSCLARLSFNRKDDIAQNVADERVRRELLEGSRAAVILAAGAASPRLNPFWRTAERLAARVYRTFWDRGYDHSEIHYVSPKSWADFNGDGFNDFIVDAPVDSKAFVDGTDERDLAIEDVRNAFEWAASKGALTQPLFVYVVGNGPGGQVMLSPSEALDGAELGSMIDAYQTATNNRIVVIIESGRSGAWIPTLSGPDRVIVASSGADELSYYDRTGMLSFTSAFMEPLGRGDSLRDALSEATQTMKSGYGVVDVAPVMDDNGDGVVNFLDGLLLSGHLGLNGVWETGRGSAAVEPAAAASAIHTGSSAALEARVVANYPVKEVLAVVRPPYPDIGSDGFGAPIMSNPVYTLTDPDGDGVFSGATDNLPRAGDYFATYVAMDYKNNPSRSAGMALTVEHASSNPAWFTIEEDLDFTIPCVKANGAGFEALFKSYNAPNDPFGLYWKVERETIRETGNTNCIEMGPNLGLDVRHAAFMGYTYRFTLDFYLNPADPNPTNSYWKLDWSTLAREGRRAEGR